MNIYVNINIESSNIIIKYNVSQHIEHLYYINLFKFATGNVILVLTHENERFGL